MQILKDNWARANMVIVADLDGDGRLDVAACAERGSNELRWWRNEGLLPGESRRAGRSPAEHEIRLGERSRRIVRFITRYVPGVAPYP